MGCHAHAARRCQPGVAAGLTLWALCLLLLAAALIAVVEANAAVDASQQATFLSPLLMDEAEDFDTGDLDTGDALGWAADSTPIAIARRIPEPGLACGEQSSRPDAGKGVSLLAAPKTSPPRALR